ncbi:hypothetical protein KVV02_003277 [Mortierella alpina]|uniref:Uncharacterized protein n=1 Tax=Mortierella alpina TaxID=64518 RepID=A0A9P8A8P5_MORAP|nr:hypothetical protein KVV02_003277 [Mortierella alpina]
MSALSAEDADDHVLRSDSSVYRANAATDRTPSYSELHLISAALQSSQESPQAPIDTDTEPPYTARRTISSQDIVVVSPRPDQAPPPMELERQQQQLLSAPASHTTPSGLTAALELESDTVEIYDRSSDGFQYSLKGSVELDWTTDMELVLKDARIDFMGYADTAVLRYESGGSTATTETPVHHTHDFIPTPLVLDSGSNLSPPVDLPAHSGIASPRAAERTPTHRHHESLPIDLTLPGHLPDSTNLAIGNIRYELQVSLEVTSSPGTSPSTTESIILRRPILIHRIVYPSAHLQPRIAMGLDSGGVEIQVKVPRLFHCENTLLAVELYAKPRTRNVKLRKAKVVFEQIETDRYQRSPPVSVPPTAIVPLAPTNNSSTATASPTAFPSDVPSPAVSQSPPRQWPPPLPLTRSGPRSGLPPAPRLLTRQIAQPLEVDFDEPTAELQSQTVHLQLVLSPDLCVDVQSSWLQISHTLRIEIEYTTDEEAYITAPPVTAPPPPPPLSPQHTPIETPGTEPRLETGAKIELDAAPVLSQPASMDGSQPMSVAEEEEEEEEEEVRDLEAEQQESGQTVPKETEDQKSEAIWQQQGDDIESASQGGDDPDDWRSRYLADEKQPLQDGEGSGSSTLPRHHFSTLMEGADVIVAEDRHLAPRLPSRPSHVARASTLSATSSTTSSCTFSVATEEIPVRVVRVVATALVDASTIAQAAGETEAGLPTYESVIEATGLPAYAEEKLEDDHEDAEASGTATGVLGGAARRLEGDDAELQRR